MTKMTMKKKIELAKLIAEKQMDDAMAMEYFDDADMIWFEHDGVHIISPWYSCDGRWDYNDMEAVREYGLANVMDFIERAVNKR